MSKLEELEERIADPDAGLELKPDVEERLTRSSKLPRESLITAADMRKQLGHKATEKKYKPTKEQMQSVLEFAIKNQCVVNPMGWNSALENFNEFKSCVCDPSRHSCPCEQAPQEIKEKGHCKCNLFFRDYETYGISRSLIQKEGADGR